MVSGSDARAKGAQLTVWYDGGCPLCAKEISMLRRLDKIGAIDFVDVSKGQSSSCPIDQADLLAKFHVLEGDAIHSGAAAFAALWRAIPILRPLGLAARLPGVLPVMNALYATFLRIRPGLIRFFFG